MDLPRVYVNHMTSLDRLAALEFGRVDDGQPSERWRPLSADFAYLTEGERIVGFVVNDFSSFDSEAMAIWDTPRFHVPQLGLPESPAGEIVIAVRALLGDRSSFNRLLFAQACNADDAEQELAIWMACLTSGDAMAHFGLGCTLYKLGRFREAYRHLRYYVTIAPGHPWNWCWYGKAAEAMGELAEARLAYERTIALDDSEDEAGADARERLVNLGSPPTGSPGG